MVKATIKAFLAGLLASVITACVHTGPVQTIGLIESAKNNQRTVSQGDHDALSRYFENAAREMRAKAAEQRRLLDHYEDKSYLYGRSAQDLKSHTAALIRKYDETAEKNIQEAATHRQMALEQAGDNLAAKSE